MDGPILEFEKPIVELEEQIEEMRNNAVTENHDALNKEIRRLEGKLDRLRRDIYSKLTRWQRVQIARHPHRPHTLDYIEGMMTDFVELHGDRAFGDDKAIVAGMAKLDGEPVVVVGHQKGRDTKENLMRNFGMAGPEGYRKAMRVLKLAEKFRMPVLSLVDTPGAYPGAGAEERGQAEAIARNIYEMGRLPVPIIVVVIGEGASGGAMGIGVGDRILMMEHAWFTTITPEACSTILWKDQEKAAERKIDCAEALRLTSDDLQELGVIDGLVALGLRVDPDRVELVHELRRERPLPHPRRVDGQRLNQTGLDVQEHLVELPDRRLPQLCAAPERGEAEHPVRRALVPDAGVLDEDVVDPEEVDASPREVEAPQRPGTLLAEDYANLVRSGVRVGQPQHDANVLRGRQPGGPQRSIHVLEAPGVAGRVGTDGDRLLLGEVEGWRPRDDPLDVRGEDPVVVLAHRRRGDGTPTRFGRHDGSGFAEDI